MRWTKILIARSLTTECRPESPPTKSATSFKTGTAPQTCLSMDKTHFLISLVREAKETHKAASYGWHWRRAAARGILSLKREKDLISVNAEYSKLH